MASIQNEAATGRGVAAGGMAPGGALNRPHSTTISPPCQADLDPLAVYHLARLLAGAADADRAAILAEWPECPIGSGPLDRAAIQTWLERCPDLLRAVLATDPSTPPLTLRATAPVATWADLGQTLGPITWAWQGWLPNGFLTIIAGENGVGKSALALRLCACFVRGDPWPDGTEYHGQTGAVLWVEAEASQALNLDRARCWGLPLERIYAPLPDPLDDARLDNAEHRDRIMEIACRAEVRMVVVDSLRGAHSGDENDSGVIGVVAWLAQMARNTGKPVLITHHLRKRGLLDSGAEVSLDRLRGSSALVQPARCVWAVDRPDPTSTARRVAVIKCNLGPFPGPLGLEIGPEGVTFGRAPEAPRIETLQDKAADMLRALLRPGPRRAADLQTEIEGAGLSWAAAKRAKQALGIVSVKREDGWWWGLPERSSEERE